MKSRLLLHIWPNTRCALLGYVVLTFLSLPVLANNKTDPGFRTFADTVISGKITDGKGSPLGGVNILEKGTNTGATSDEQGNFSILSHYVPVFPFQNAQQPISLKA